MCEGVPYRVIAALNKVVDYIFLHGKKADFFICATSEDDKDVMCVNYGNEYMGLACHLKHIRNMIDNGAMSRHEVVVLCINMLYGEGEDDD